MDISSITTPPANFVYYADNDNDHSGPILFAQEIFALPPEDRPWERYVL